MSEENFEETQTEETTSEETEVVDETTEDVDVSDETSETEDIEALKTKARELEEKNKQLFARLKKTGEKKAPTNSTDIELIEFFAQGNSRADYEKLQVIMKGSGLTLSEAQQDPLYQSYKEKVDRERRDDKAQLGSSKSSSSSDQTFKSGMTPEEHKEAWKKARQ